MVFNVSNGVENNANIYNRPTTNVLPWVRRRTTSYDWFWLTPDYWLRVDQ